MHRICREGSGKESVGHYHYYFKLEMGFNPHNILPILLKIRTNPSPTCSHPQRYQMRGGQSSGFLDSTSRSRKTRPYLTTRLVHHRPESLHLHKITAADNSNPPAPSTAEEYRQDDDEGQLLTDDDWEVAALIWGLMAVAGLGMAHAGVGAAETIHKRRVKVEQ